MIVFGLSLFVIGLLLFIFAIIKGFFKSLFYFLKNVLELLGVCFYIIYDYIFVTRKDKKTGYYQKQLLREQLEKESLSKKIEKEKREIVIGAMNFATKMRANYPYADESLFQEAMTELPKDNCRKTTKDYEELIKESHNYNLVNKPKFSSSRTFTLVDLENLDPIEVRKENPITMSLYQIELEYILWVHNSQTDENTLLQTKDYQLMASYMITILELQQNLREFKESIRSIQLENIFNVKKESTNKYNTTNYNFNRRW